MLSQMLIIFCLFTGVASAEEAAVPHREKIRRVVRDNISKVRQCYEKELNRNPELAGKLVIDWEIDDKGSATGVVVNNAKSDLKSDNTAKCVAETITTLKFPASEKGKSTSVTFPFYFNK